MKKIYLFFAVSLLIVSCTKSPKADFYVEITKAKIGSEVFFINASTDADSYEWDFGDGAYSKVENPVHVYKTVGTYTVTLTAFSKTGKESKKTINLIVVEPTLLVIEVLEYYDEYHVSDASVILYPTLKDWDNTTNAVIEGFTDEDGIVVFGGLNSGVYYVDVWEEYHDNWQLGQEHERFIKTGVVADKVIWFVAWVDYTYYKGNSRGEKKMIIKKLEKRQPNNTYQNREIDYETLLKKSVIMK